ncbi:hypothetical protein ES703_83340 [subsurface metagenome]
MYDIIKQEFTKIIKENGLESGKVVIGATPLSPQEAIGNPEDRDYPLIIGVERLMQAEFRDCRGQAFTDMYGDFSGRLSDIMEMDLTNNFRRAIFISSLNAVMRYLGLVDKTVHCKDNEPRECSRELVKHIETNYGHPKLAMVGFQPRMVEALSKDFELRVTDMDQDNIGTEKFGVIIHSPEKTQENLSWCDIALVTGTTIVNNAIDQFKISKPVVYYGITISGVAKLLGLNHFCYYGH